MNFFELHPLVRRLSSSPSFIVSESLDNLASSVAKAVPIIGTHNGTFHCDEALACGMLKLLPKYQSSPVLRTRDLKLLEICEAVVDVGAEYDPNQLRFDHHQREFCTKFSDERRTLLSSAGLIYKHFGKRLIELVAEHESVQLREALLEKLYEKTYTEFIEHIDGIDNGVPAADGVKNYSITTSLSSRVGRLNPSWNSSEEDSCSPFKKAVLISLNEFVLCLSNTLLHWLPAREYVVEAVAKRAEIDPSQEILKLNASVPWKSHLFDIEKEQPGLAGKLKYVLYPRDNGDWSVQCIPVEPDSFTSRKPLPQKYRGLRDEELSSAWGISGCIFVHRSGFIGGNKTFEGVLQMAKSALHATE